MDLTHDHGVFSISVAAELTGVNPQMLRSYETRGLLEPFRTSGGTRRYSGRDLDRVNEITTLLAAGLNLTGIEHVLRLQAETHALRAEIARLQQTNPTAPLATGTARPRTDTPQRNRGSARSTGQASGRGAR